jgi:ABC-2 type transport system ATP-binding protein
MIEVQELTKTYRHFTAVKRLSFKAEPGQVTGFLGPNGAGKTTTIDMILGLARPDGGEATINGKPFHKLADPVREVGAVLAGGAFHDGRSARASLLATAAMAGLPARRVDEVIEQVGLADAPGRRVGNYSLGMRQRLSLAQALLGDPQVLICDEPTNGLDPGGIKWLRETLQSLAHDQGKTVLLSSHILTEVRETVDTVVVIAEGQLASEFSLRDLDAGTGQVIARTPQAEDLARAVERDGVTAIRDGDTVRISGMTTLEVGEAAVKAQIALAELQKEHFELERRYMELTQGKGR